MSHPYYGDAPPEVIAEFEAERTLRIEENRRRIAAGQYGDVPDDLTEEDERILDQIWRELGGKRRKRNGLPPECQRQSIIRRS